MNTLPLGYHNVGNRLFLDQTFVGDLYQKNSGPTYAYSREGINQRISDIMVYLPESISLHYAIKANPMPEVVRHVANLTGGLDVASAAELQLAAQYAEPSDISFAGPGKSAVELEAAIRIGVVIVVESVTELDRIAGIASRLHLKPSIALRVNPLFELKASGMRMGGGSQPFGIDEEKISDVVRYIAELPVQLLGFHIFSGSQNLNADNLSECFLQTLQLGLRLARENQVTLRWLNLGGGLGVPYFAGETALDFPKIGNKLKTMMMAHRDALKDTEVIVELGRYIVAEAGIYVAQITDRKVSRGRTYIVTNGGLHHHLAASGNFGQVIRRNYPVCVAERLNPQGEYPEEEVTVVGPLCTPLDVITDRVKLPSPQIGDHIVVFQSGAYGATASPQNFLSHPPPGEVLI